MANERFYFSFEGLSPLSYPRYQAEKSIRSLSPSDRPNAFSLFKAIYLESRIPGTYRDLRIEVSSDVAGFNFKPVHLSRLSLGEKCVVDSFSYSFDERALHSFDMERPINFRISLFANGNEIAKQDFKTRGYTIEGALADGEDPVLLASYVTPEDARLERLFEKAERILKDRKVPLIAYEDKDPNTVLAEAFGIYDALRNEKLELNRLPSGKSRILERISLPGETLTKGKGTSLDIALVYASLVEKAGLHPLVFLFGEKALVGVYLDGDNFTTSYSENPSSFLVASSVGYDRLLLVDPSSGMGFEDSRLKAYKDLEDGKNFLGVVDVFSARRENILPLPTPGEKGNLVYPDLTRKERSGISGIDLSTHRYIDTEDRGDKSRYDHWLDRLLDLNLKNRLINLRPGKSLPQLLVPDAESFLDVLKDNKKLTLVPYESYAGTERKIDNILDFPASYYKKIADESYKKGMVPFLLCQGEPTDDIIKSLSRRSNTALEESGSNPLFLTVGLLRHYENDKSAEKGKGAMYAPIFLLPVRIPLRKNTQHFYFEYDYDDISVNTTLFEYLDQAYGIDLTAIEGTIRRKDGQVDLRLIYNHIREKIASKKGFALIENASGVGLFSFAHFVMWDDLRRRKEDLLTNPHISSMVSGTISFKEPENLLSLDELDEGDNGLIPLPLPADSSQIKAIDDALKGASFVMDGPPGTGKSQTIANMIVAFLSKGKKVLFVAEKEVALEVVKRRLDEIGLGRFALFLSSSRTAKGDVLKSLGELIGMGPVKGDVSFEEASNKLKASRDKLNSIISSIHGKSPFLFSIEEGIGVYLSTMPAKGKFVFPLDEARALDRGHYDRAIEALTNLVRADAKLGGYKSSPFLPFVGESYTPMLRDSLLKEIEPLIAIDKDLYLAEHNAFMVLPEIEKSRQNATIFCEIVELDRKCGGLLSPYFGTSSYPSRDLETKEKLERFVEARKARREVLSRFKESVYELNPDTIESFARDIENAGFFARGRARKSMAALLSEYYLGAGKPSKREISGFIEQYRQSLKIDVPTLEALKSLLGDIVSERPETLVPRFESTVEASKKLDSMIKGKKGESKARKKLASTQKPFGSDAANRLANLLKSHSEKSHALLTRHAFDLRLYADGDDYFKKEAILLNDCLNRSGEMASYFAFLEALRAARPISSGIVEEFENGKIPCKSLVDSYKNALAYLVVGEAASSSSLSSLSHDEIETILDTYAEDLKDFREASIAECASVVTSKYPSPSAGTAASSDLYRLRKLIANGGRGVTLRNLLKEFGGLISTLCPCYLMSPLSVAQFLRKEDRFDVAIFDEASQIPTSEAVGAISHADSIVISGDQMQMPPTDFFKSTVTGVEEGEDSFVSLDEDLESLLDDVIVMGYPRNRLNFHYRSKNENLISFSNERFYGNSLYTFPSPGNDGTGVSFRKVKGDYQVGRGTNRPEALAVVEEVARRLADPIESKRSIGIVTFNEAQQNLILDLLEKKVSKAFAFREDVEPIFVKNLENVQGDERDVILFSTTYGPNKQGELSLNFGPLSREKGERRLNVAITRARVELVVFSSFQPEDIRAERAKNAGARYLRDFLMFARDGSSALYRSAGSLSYETKGMVATSLASDLRKLGYDVDLDVGTSLFRVDLAVKKDDGYGVGVLLDGASYLSTPTCLDRNLVQPSVLSSLGWNFVRFYCIEYFDRPEEVVREIVSLLNSPRKKVETKKEKLEIPDFEKLEMDVNPNKVPYRVYEGPVSGANEEEAFVNAVKSIIDTEYPISASLLEKRVKEVLSIKTMSSKYRSLLGVALTRIKPAREEYPNEEIFYYPAGTDPRSYSYYRTELKECGREISQVSFIELSNLYKDILLVEGRLYKEDLAKMAVVRFGSPAFKKKNNDHLLLAIKSAVSNHRGIKFDEDGYVVLEHGG